MTDAHGYLLYADDNADDRLLLRTAVQAAFPNVTLQCVADGEAAIAAVRDALSQGQYCLPHVVLLDVNMPRKDGLATLAELKADPLLRALPVVMVGAARRPEDPERARQLGAEDFVRKPRSQHELMETLRALSHHWSQAAPPFALAG